MTDRSHPAEDQGGARRAPLVVPVPGALTVRDAGPADLAEILAINNAATPNVNALDAEPWAWLTAHATYHRIAVDAEGIAGVILCVPAGLPYWSDNYKWFTARFSDFLYLDRVVVAERARNRGVGTALYADLHATVAGRWPRVTLEVNLRPPNPGSQRFHERLGYQPVGVRESEGGAYAVQMYERAV